MSAVLDAAFDYARLGWRVFPASGKKPLTDHGFKDASCDSEIIRGWWRRWPGANVAIATGAPGPTVLDVDNLTAAAGLVAQMRKLGGPEVASKRGPHFYFGGLDRRTVGLGFGELRSLGSYVLAPPSIHPSGREYVWLQAPNGTLPAVPGFVAKSGRTTGCGKHQAAAELVPHGQRHPYLCDFAVRLLRAGVTDRGRITAHLRLEFELSCVPLPRPGPRYFEQLAEWAAESRIADRKRATNDLAVFIRNHEQQRQDRCCP